MNNSQPSENETQMEIETSCDRLGITIAEKEDKLRYYYTMSSSEDEVSEEEKIEEITFQFSDSEKETESKVEEELPPKPKNPYSEFTSESVANTASKLCRDQDYQIGCICCPLVFNSLQENLPTNGKLFLFDKDKDKDQVAESGKNFIHYNFSDNKKLKEFEGAFDVLLMFAPKLSDDPVIKIVNTLNYLRNKNCKILLVVSNTYVRVDEDFRESIKKLDLVEINWGITTATVKKDIYYFSNHKIEE